MSELNYERAVIEFQIILEIEPMNAEAYLGLAEAYVGIGRTNKTIRVLKDGYKVTGDERLKDMIDELEREDEPPVSSSTGSSGDINNSSIETSEPAQNAAAYGSMGFVTVAGTEIDIAATKTLFIVNKAKHDEGRNIRYSNLEEYAAKYDAAVFINNDLTLQETDELSKLVNLTSLEIDYAGLSMDHLLRITKLTNLTCLRLWGNEISDISSLSKLNALKTLYLDGNNISDNDMEWLKGRLPECDFRSY